MFSWFFFSCFFVILQNPVQLVSALRLGDILIIGEKKRVEGRREEKRSFPLLPSVKTLHSVPWLSSVPHLNLTETRQADYYCIYAIEVKHHELKENSTNFIHKHQFTSNGKCYPVKPAVCQENDPMRCHSDVIRVISAWRRCFLCVCYKLLEPNRTHWGSWWKPTFWPLDSLILTLRYFQLYKNDSLFLIHS